MSTPLMKEYCEEVLRLREEFQQEVILFMQLGSFYEIYEVEDVGHAKLVSALTGITLTRKNSKLPPSRENPWMCGFPLYTLGKFITKLNDEGYTVAVYDQKPENVKERVRRGVYNPSLRMDTEEQVDTEKRLFSVILESYHLPDRVRTRRFLFSIVFVDVDTGKMGMKEFDAEDDTIGFQSFLTQFQPTEVVYQILGDARDVGDNQESCLFHLLTHTEPASYVHEAFDIPACTSAEEYMGLERFPNIFHALCNLLGFIHRHDPCLMTKLAVPTWSDGGSTLLEYNRDAFLELNVMDICHRRRSFVNKKKQKSLLDVLDCTVTPMGHRKLQEVLRFPITDPIVLEARYTHLEKTATLPYKEIRESLSQIPDVEWLLLRWKRKKASMRTVAEMLSSLQQFIAEVNTSDVFCTDRLCKALSDVGSVWDLDLMRQESPKYILQPNRQLKEELDNVDAMQKELEEWEKSLNYTKECAFKLLKIDHLYYFQTTKKRWESVKKSPFFQGYEVASSSSVCRIYSEKLHTLSRKLHFTEDKIQRLIQQDFHDTSERLLSTHPFDDFAKQLGDLDYNMNLMNFFQKNGYTRPRLIEKEVSCFDFQSLRHAIIEQIDRDRLFVPHHASLGVTNMGMLIYGINSSGKSTYLKSVGLAVWLAQCGLYVPAHSAELCPFQSFMSKIGTFDNLYMGHSTFVAEMNELHHIFRRSRPRRTLVLCDELTAGTEVMSATGIVGSTIDYFARHQICNMLTTHLHLLSKCKDLPTEMYHFAIQTGKSSSLLIEDLKIRYDRELKPGPGPDAYGIEIANDMGLPKEFVRRAMQIRSRIQYDIKSKTVTPRRSRYNRQLWMDKCIHCGRKDRLHTHHITPQQEFAKGILIHDKDGLYNLVVLCEECHEGLHH